MPEDISNMERSMDEVAPPIVNIDNIDDLTYDFGTCRGEIIWRCDYAENIVQFLEDGWPKWERRLGPLWNKDMIKPENALVYVVGKEDGGYTGAIRGDEWLKIWECRKINEFIAEKYQAGWCLNRIVYDERPIDRGFTINYGYQRASLEDNLRHLANGGKLALTPATAGYFFLRIESGNPLPILNILEENGLAYFVSWDGSSSGQSLGFDIYIQADDDILLDRNMTKQDRKKHRGVVYSWRCTGGLAIIKRWEDWLNPDNYHNSDGSKLTRELLFSKIMRPTGKLPNHVYR